MAITRVGSSKATTTPTVPTHAIGDLILGWAFRDGSTTAPSLPSGYISIATISGTSCSARLFCKVATATNDTMGASTNATETQCVVYSSTTGFCVPGYAATNAGTSNTLNYAALPAMADVSGRSWVTGGVGHRSTNQNIESPPSGMSLIDNLLDATAETALHDTNGAVSSWSSTNQTISGTASGWCSFALEICEAGPEAGDIAPIQVASASDDAVASSIAATGSAVGSGNCVVGIVWYEETSAAVSSVQDNLGVNAVLGNSYIDTSNHQIVTTFYANAVSGGPTTYTSNFSTARDFRGILWVELSDVDASSDPRDGVNGVWQGTPATSRDGVNSGSVTTTQADDALLAFVLSEAGTAITPGSGFRLLGTNSSPGSCVGAAAMRTERGTRSVSGLWTASANGPHISALVTLKKAASAVVDPFGSGSSATEPAPRAAASVANIGFVDGSEFWLLGPDVAPFAQTAWPNPGLPNRGGNVGHVDGSELWLFGAAAVPFVQSSQPNPVRSISRPPDAPFNRLLALYDRPFFQTSWPNPRGAVAPAVGFTDPSEFWLLKDKFFGADGQPPTPFSWTVPRGPVRANAGFVDAFPNRGVVVTASPFAQYDWPIPRARQAGPVGFVDAWPNRTVVVTAAPFSQEDWPLPLRRGSAAVGFTNPGLALTVQPAPFAQADWPVPRGQVSIDRGFTASLNIGLLLRPAPTQAWDNPQVARRSLPGFVQAEAVRLSLLGPRPFAQRDWPNPVRARVITVASSMRPSQNATILMPADGYVPRSDGAALLI